MTPKKLFTPGSIYGLSDIQILVRKLKMVGHRNTEMGLFIIYRETESSNYWFGGPLTGKDSNLFLFLGEQQANGRFQDFATAELGKALSGLSGKLANEVKGFIVEYFFDFTDLL